MNTIQFDSGIQEFSVNGNGVLRFHPGDPNLYARFFEAGDKIREISESLSQLSGENPVELMEKTDRKLKHILNWVFGPPNDFETILGGVNLLAVAGNGQQVIANFLEALEPVLTEGARKCAEDQVNAVKAQNHGE